MPGGKLVYDDDPAAVCVCLPAGTPGLMADLPAGVACGYCGGRHAGIAEVRECWARSLREQPASAASPAASLPGLSGPPAPWEPSPVLGRSVLVAPGQEPPGPWAHCERADGSIEQLEQAWRDRVPLVIQMEQEPAANEVEHGPVWSLSPGFAFPGERQAHATYSNSVDMRSGQASWSLAQRARQLGAQPGGPADVVLPDGRPAYLDGGPLCWSGPMGEAVVIPRLALMAGSLVPFGPNQSDAALAPDQLAAVLHPGGAARIIAPAGSGKTRVLTERARHLLRDWQLPGRAVTLVAYNKRAADEMRDRTPDLPQLQIRTLNALSLSLLSRATQVTTIEERDVRAILDGLVDLPRRANADPAAAWIEALSAVRLGLQAPERVEAEFGGDVDGLPQVFDQYRALLAERAVVDFDEQVYRAIEVLLGDPVARRAARAACRVLLVDEFQDLTPAHLLLIRLLAGPEGAVFGVGDDDQTIYGYSGASPRWLIDFQHFFPTGGEHPLQVNYRCPVPIVDAARNLLSHNRQRVPKQIMAAPGRVAGDSELVVLASNDALATTVETVISQIERGQEPASIAVLSRVNASLAPVQVALVHRGAPVRPAVDVSYMSRGGVQAALAWLRLASSPAGQLTGGDLVAAARRPSRSLSPKVLEWIGERTDQAGLMRLAGRLKGRDQDKIVGFIADMQAARRRAASGTAAVLRAVRDDIGLDRAMELLEGSRRRLEGSAQTDDLDALVALAVMHPDPAGFEDWLRNSLSNPGSPDGVVLSTVHRVKGQEWPQVVLHDVSFGLMPHRLASDIEEERRVFHVGLTRGSTQVWVVAGPKPSPFLAELSEAWEPGRSPVTSLRPPRTPSASPGRPGILGVEERRVVAEIGLQFERLGRHHQVTDLDDDCVWAEVGQARVRVPYGELVVLDEHLSRLVRPPAPPAAVEHARRALRAWRSRKAAAAGKPPYIFLYDRTIEAIAQEAPASMAALARIDGIGPAKLESYGDELLAIVAAAREAGAAG
jgi:DNA helicase-2/ATP-dependent DNA helicase PcrA